MSSLNKIILIGEVQSNPDIKATNSGDAVCNFILNVQRPARVENANPGSDNIKVVAWREKAELMKSVQDGQMLLVEGRIHTRSYDNNEGQKVYVTEVEAREIRPMNSNQPARLEAFQVPRITEEMPAKKPRKKPVLEERNNAQEDKSFDFSDDEKVLVTSSNQSDFESDDIPF